MSWNYVLLGEFYTHSLLLTLIICLIPLLIPSQSNQSHPRGCRRLGLDQSNLNEFDLSKPLSNKDQNDKPVVRIKSLFIYPLKSCRGIELQSSDVVRTGLKYDRQFIFAEKTSSDSVCRTLRNAGYERLALIRPEIWIPDPSLPDYDPSLPEIQSGGVLNISYPRVLPRVGLFKWLIQLGMNMGLLKSAESFSIPLHQQSSSFPIVPVKIWKDTLQTREYTTLLPPSLHTYLGFNHQESPLTLLGSTSQTREIHRNAPPAQKLGFQATTTFADAYPIHLLNISSHADVAKKCASLPQLSIRRFRASIIIEGPNAFEEDDWKRILIGDTEVYVACRTIRCKLPNVDPDSGRRHVLEPDRTLKRYRRIDEGDLTNACLGMQLVPAVKEWVVNVGDEVRVLEVGRHRYIKLLDPGEIVEGV